MNDHLQHKLYNYQVQPPSQVWDKITVALQETEKPLSERLVTYELEAPAYVWDNISAVLDEEKPPVIPFRKRIAKPLRYSTAAASLIAIAVLVSLLINKKSVSEVTINPPAKLNTTSVISPTISDEPPVVFRNNGVEAANKIVASNKKNASRKVVYTPSTSGYREAEGRSTYVLPHNYPIEKSDLLDRYILFSKTPGEAFRVSKKLFDLFACSDNDENCRHNIEVMQQKAATSSLVASADFSGIIDLLQNIENQ